MERARFRDGWIFSPVQDFAFFWLPILAAYLLWSARFVRADPKTVALSFLLFATVPLNDGHIFLTSGPLFRRKIEGRLSGVELILGPFAVLVFSLVFLSYAPDLFLTVFAVAAAHHIMAQQHGWVMVSRRRAAEPAGERLFDTIEIWNIMLVPLIWGFSTMSGMEKRWFAQTVLFTFPASLARAALLLHWAINGLYVGRVLHQLRRGIPLNRGKLLLMASTWLWFYPSLVIFQSRALFFEALVLIHALPYMKFSRSDAATPTRGDAPESKALTAFGNLYAALLISVGLGALQYSIGPRLSGLWGGSPWIRIVLLSPAILHYYFDAFIWRRSRWPASSS